LYAHDDQGLTSHELRLQTEKFEQEKNLQWFHEVWYDIVNIN
jgi:hypothetical protein